jgi:hypothetical protein
MALTGQDIIEFWSCHQPISHALNGVHLGHCWKPHLEKRELSVCALGGALQQGDESCITRIFVLMPKENWQSSR